MSLEPPSILRQAQDKGVFTTYDAVRLTASRYERRIRDFCDRLDYASERGHRRDDIRPGLRIVGFERRVTVAFMLDESRVTILRLFYGGQDWEGAF